MAYKSPWDHWYGLGRWKKRRRAQLLREPLCKFCLARGVVVPATVVDHVKRHRGNNWNEFITAPVQSLCKPCHDSTKRTIEQRGFSRDVDPATGYPTDENHPWYASEKKTAG